MIPQFFFNLDDGLDESFLPTKSDPNATGWDVKCAEKNLVLNRFQIAKINLGFRAIIPEGYWLELRPRSSTFGKKNLHCLYGVIDVNYENNVLLAAQWIPNKFDLDYSLNIEFGERIGQIIPVKKQDMTTHIVSKEEFDNLSKNRNINRGGGFGSTGNK